MSAESPSEVELFQQYVGDRLARGTADASLEQTLADFRAYQQQLNELRGKVHEAIEESVRGESAPFDAESSKRRLRERLAQESTGERQE
ncbi:MAG: hypothetical protein KDA63_07750 [Planctomycetales bacterium]|nr:hypothetical protein [Planctomycetales bacterium]